MRGGGGSYSQAASTALMASPLACATASIESRCNGPQGTSAGPLHVPDDREDICPHIAPRCPLWPGQRLAELGRAWGRRGETPRALARASADERRSCLY